MMRAVEVKRALVGHASLVLDAFNIPYDGSDELRAKSCPSGVEHRRASVAVNRASGEWHCHACGEKAATFSRSSRGT